MPVQIQLASLKYRNSLGEFQSADCLKGESADISIIAPDYGDLTFPVASGTLCTHDYKLYKAHQTIQSQEEWTEAHWTETTIEDEINGRISDNIIDDSAGAGNTSRTWSADKLTGEFVLKAPKANPVFTGSISMGRKASTTVGAYSSVNGYNAEATAQCSRADGFGTKATNNQAHAEGENTTASGIDSHSEGVDTTASSWGSHSEGNATTASGMYAHSEGVSTTASGDASHSQGIGTIANHRSQITSGEYNVADNSNADASQRGNYVEIVGNGASNNARSNARTLDWNGNEALAGDLTINKGSANETSVGAIKTELDSKAPIANPEFTGSISMGRAKNTTIGAKSVAIGANAEATAPHSVSLGIANRANMAAFAQGDSNNASAYCSFARGFGNVAKGNYSSATGFNSVISGNASYAFGRYNVDLNDGTQSDSLGTYIEIVGNGTGDDDRSNARTLDQSGNENLSGDLKIFAGTNNEVSVSGLNNDIYEIYNGKEVVTPGSGSINKLNMDEAQTGMSLNASGEPSETASRWITGFIPVEDGKQNIALTGNNVSATVRMTLQIDRIAFYDSSKTFVSKQDNVTSHSVASIPSGTAFVRMSIVNDYYQRSPMVEFVDSESEISSTFVEYIEKTTTIHGIYYLNEVADDAVKDVQVNGSSVVTNGVANVPIATDAIPGVVKVAPANGLYMAGGQLLTNYALPAQVQAATEYKRPIVPYIQHQSTFYGLAKAAGDTTQSVSSNAVGTYTPEAQSAIQKMFGLNEKWEYINVIESGDEDTEMIICNVDQNLQPFALKAAVVIIYSAVSQQVTGNVSIKVGFSPIATGTSANYELANITAGIRTTAQQNVAYARIAGIIPDGKNATPEIDSSKISIFYDVGSEVASYTAKKAIFNINSSLSDGYIHNVYVSGKYFGPGSFIRVWGIRA